MSTIRTNAIIDAAGGNTATINGKTPVGTSDFASQAQAEAGTDNTTLMTPLRTAEAVAALGGATTLLGTLTLTGSASQTLPGLTLTPYKMLHVLFVNLSPQTGAGSVHTFTLAGATIGPATAAISDTWRGRCDVNLVNGDAISSGAYNLVGSPASGVATTYMLKTALTTASTSITVACSTTMDSGTAYIYGVK